MEKVKVKVNFIDDVSGDGERYSKRLTRGRHLDVQFFLPSPELNVDALTHPPPDLFLVDYELIKERAGGVHASYQGGTLATAIREKMTEYPIVLITRKGLVVWERNKRIMEASQTFDGVVYKSDIDKDPVGVIKQLMSIAEGFQILREQEKKDWKALLGVLEATEEEGRLLREAAPPPLGWQVLEAARWIRNVVLTYPGILYDPLHAATALGIEKDAFLEKRVQKLMKDAKYSGIFVPPEGRWWRIRLFAAAGELTREEGIQGPINRAFAKAFQKRYWEELLLAKCIYSGETPADWVCYILKEPVKIRYSLVYHPDRRPAVMDDARVSFKAIRESNEVFDELFDAESAKLLQEIRERPDVIEES
jgi:hypothetical protein